MTTFSTSREIPATAEQVFAAFRDPKRLARWWGPAGFTNTFHLCEFESGGRWSYTMHGPNGANFRNESVFAEVTPAEKVVIQHVSEPKYRLTILLNPSSSGTIVSWAQAFEKPDVASRIEHIVVPANEQNLDRLTQEVLRETRFPAAVPEIPVSDLDAALEYYASRLGFTIDWGNEGGGGIAGLSKGNCRLFLTDAAFRAQYGNRSPVVTWLNLDSREEVDALYETWRGNQVNVISPPEDKPWGLHEFTVADPDGNRLRVFHDFATPEREKAAAEDL